MSEQQSIRIQPIFMDYGEFHFPHLPAPVYGFLAMDSISGQQHFSLPFKRIPKAPIAFLHYLIAYSKDEITIKLLQKAYEEQRAFVICGYLLLWDHYERFFRYKNHKEKKPQTHTAGIIDMSDLVSPSVVLEDPPDDPLLYT